MREKFTKIVTKDKKRNHNKKRYVFIGIFFVTSHFLKQGKGERKCNANWYVKIDVLCIFNLYKEISDNLHPSTEQQAESSVPDLVQTISQSMEYRMVDIDEDAEESFF